MKFHGQVALVSLKVKWLLGFVEDVRSKWGYYLYRLDASRLGLSNSSLAIEQRSARVVGVPCQWVSSESGCLKLNVDVASHLEKLGVGLRVVDRDYSRRVLVAQALFQTGV